MSSREANIDSLNLAIATLSEDAEDVHGLIMKSVDGLENATAAGNRAADNAELIIKQLAPLTQILDAQHRDSTAMLEDAKKASDEQRAMTVEQIEALKATVRETLRSVTATTEEQGEALKTTVGEALASVVTTAEATCAELRKTVEDSFDGLEEAQSEAFEEFKTKTIKEQERTRDELQTDILAFKNTTSARLDALEASIVKEESAIKSLEGTISESTDTTTKKLLIPLYAAIIIGAINLVCLAVLLMR